MKMSEYLFFEELIYIYLMEELYEQIYIAKRFILWKRFVRVS